MNEHLILFGREVKPENLPIAILSTIGHMNIIPPVITIIVTPENKKAFMVNEEYELQEHNLK
ncbi:hypothetical protein D3C75_623120 [compost metagenome]